MEFLRSRSTLAITGSNTDLHRKYFAATIMQFEEPDTYRLLPTVVPTAGRTFALDIPAA
jgi:hypothetical protein